MARNEIDEYIDAFHVDLRKILNKLRSTVRKAAPKAEESISYGIPTFKLEGKVLIYFAGFKNHVSVYPAPRAEDEFKEILRPYKGGKGTVQFPLGQPVPYELVKRIVEFRQRKILESRQK